MTTISAHVIPSPSPSSSSPSSGLLKRLWLLGPLLLLAAALSLVASNSESLLNKLGAAAPPADEFSVSRVAFVPGEIRVTVLNPQSQELTVGSITVDEQIMPFEIDGGPAAMDRLDRRTIVVSYPWIQDHPYGIGITSSSGITTDHEITAAIPAAKPNFTGLWAAALIGILVGIVPVALGMLWLPSLRVANPSVLTAFMALTAGMLTFLAVDSFAEALELQARLAGAFSGTGLVLFGMASSYLVLAWLSTRWSRSRGGSSAQALSAGMLATLIAAGIGLHNLGEGLAIGSAFALGEFALGSFFIIGFMVHNVTEGIGIVSPLARTRSAGFARLVTLALLAGAPAIAGVWIGRYIANDLLGVLFFSMAVGAAIEVIVEVTRNIRKSQPQGLFTGWTAGGFVAGLALMYATGLIVA